MIKIAIVEDSPADAALLMQHLEHFSAESAEPFSAVRYEDPECFLSEYNGSFDLILMDIELPGMNGMECARRLREADNEVVLIFITNMARYAVNGYEVNALDFIVKPVTYPLLAMKLRRAVSSIQKARDEFISLSLKNGFARVAVSDIYYLEVQGHYITYHTANGDFTVRETLKSATEKLSSYSFALARNSHLVNLRHVSFITDGRIHMHGDDIYISRSYRNAFMTALTEYLEGTIH